MDHVDGRPLISFVIGRQMRLGGAAESRTGAAWLDDRHADPKGCYFLSQGVEEPFEAPFAGVIHRSAWKGRLSAESRHDQDTATSLFAQMRKRSAGDSDRTE